MAPFDIFDKYDAVDMGRAVIGTVIGLYAGYSIYKWISNRRVTQLKHIHIHFKSLLAQR